MKATGCKTLKDDYLFETRKMFTHVIKPKINSLSKAVIFIRAKNARITYSTKGQTADISKLQ